MNYEAVLLDTEAGFHRRGVGANPAIAVTNAFRKYLKTQLPENQEDEADNISPVDIKRNFLMVNVNDEMMGDPKTLKEEVNTEMILIRVDKTKEAMYCPLGWVRPIF